MRISTTFYLKIWWCVVIRSCVDQAFIPRVTANIFIEFLFLKVCSDEISQPGSTYALVPSLRKTRLFVALHF